MVGDLLQNDEAGQDQAHRAPQPRVGLLTAIGPVPLAVLYETSLIRPDTRQGLRECATTAEGMHTGKPSKWRLLRDEHLLVRVKRILTMTALRP